MATTIVTESPALVFLNHIRAEYAALTDAERAAVSRNDVAWVAALLRWAADACPEPHRADMLSHAAAAALVAALCWA